MSTAAQHVAANVDFEIIHKLILSGQTIVDISPRGQEWLDAVFAQHTGMRALFYASQDAEMAALYSPAAGDQRRAAYQGSGNTDGSDLDGDTLREGIRHIHYLHIGSAKAVRRVLKGAPRLLQHSRIDFLEFPLDTFDLWTVQTVNQYLAGSGYAIFEIGYEGDEAGVLKSYPLWDPERQHKIVQIVAIHQRVLPMIAQDEPSARLNVYPFQVAANFGIHIRGVIQVGAYDGQREREFYKTLGLRHTLLIEANPDVFRRLEENYKDLPHIALINRAILDKTGPVEFHVTNYDEGNSILKPARVLEHYAGVIKEDHVIKVPGVTLDELLEERNLMAQWFNALLVDIQGAELLAFKGAAKLLRQIDMIITEVNFDDMYQGCGQIDELDDFLAPYGFRRVYTHSIHRAWGDALYIKAQFVAQKPAETPNILFLLQPGGDATSGPGAIRLPVSI